ncbi:MAG: hypothetical protein K1X94_09010 [Sandaracinaceae bacterium]|nr:hypothetical protein [Sandaracinaceae bacterium]
MLLAQDGGPELPRDAFVFLGHQGYVYLWFHTARGAAAGVYRYVESDRAFSRVSEDFRTWLEGAVRDELGGPRWSPLGKEIRHLGQLVSSGRPEAQ